MTGLGIGLAGALAATRLLARFVSGAGTADPATFAAVAAILFSVALCASYIPSRRALRVDLMSALRAE